MEAQARLVSSPCNPKKRVLFIGRSEEQTTLIADLINAGCEVWHTRDKIESTRGFDLVVSYGYRHLINKSTIETSKVDIINLHISYLPWNRGAHPNFWSFFDSTPSGVSIHLVDAGIDTGPVLFQRYVNFEHDKLTFSQTYEQLIIEIESLFREKLNEIIGGVYTLNPQRRKGSYHRVSDLPAEFLGWESNIKEEISRLDKLLLVRGL